MDHILPTQFHKFRNQFISLLQSTLLELQHLDPIGNHDITRQKTIDSFYSILKEGILSILLFHNAYKTYIAIQSRDLKKAHYMLAYWTANACIRVMRKLNDTMFKPFINSWIYKSIDLTLTLTPLLMGERRIYDIMVAPFFREHQEELDKASQVIDNTKDMVKSVTSKAVGGGEEAVCGETYSSSISTPSPSSTSSSSSLLVPPSQVQDSKSTSPEEDERPAYSLLPYLSHHHHAHAIEHLHDVSPTTSSLFTSTFTSTTTSSRTPNVARRPPKVNGRAGGDIDDIQEQDEEDDDDQDVDENTRTIMKAAHALHWKEIGPHTHDNSDINDNRDRSGKSVLQHALGMHRLASPLISIKPHSPHPNHQQQEAQDVEGDNSPKTEKQPPVTA